MSISLPRLLPMVLQITNSPRLCNESSPSLSANTARQHLLTVNVEDYFQVGVFQKFIQADNWYRFESRLRQNVEHVLQLLEQHNTQATFFVLGWTAENQPELVRAIADAGHEVASRGFLHRPLIDLPHNEIREDLQKARAVLQDVTGQAIDGFRLSDGWIGKSSLWLLDEIAAAGYRYDSSVMPKQRDFADEPEWRSIREVETSYGPILEVPLTTMQTAGGWLPIAGGNYQRQMPDFLMKRLVGRTVAQQVDPFVMYFQVWELDEKQPELSVADRMTRLRHYRKLGKYRRILPKYLERYQFTSIRNHAQLVGSPLESLSRPAPLTAKTPLPPVLGDVAESPSVESPVQSNCERQVRKTEATIVIPCFNEEKTVRYLANTLRSVTTALSENYSPRIIFVDDCSTDSTFETLTRQFGDDPDIRIVRHDVNRGVSAAILTGLQHAETEVVGSMDCDCSYDPHELCKMLPLLANDVSMVTASPYHKDGLVRNVPAWRLVLSRGLSVMYQKLLKQELATWTACFRVYRRDHVLDLPLKEDGFLGTAELAAQLILKERKVVEHPTTLEVRLFGLSKMKTVRAILSHLRLITRIAVSRFTKGKAEI